MDACYHLFVVEHTMAEGVSHEPAAECRMDVTAVAVCMCAIASRLCDVHSGWQVVEQM
jgi:hypothetical protein